MATGLTIYAAALLVALAGSPALAVYLFLLACLFIATSRKES